MNGARWLVQALQAEGVDTLFGYPGGTIMPFYDALHGAPLKHVLVRHEQGAAFAANGYARASGRVGVCVATSGPGASNLVTGIADAMFDSVPMVVITGQVPTFLMGTDAFQELDVFGMTMPIVKHSFLPRSVDELPDVVAEAFRIARSGRPGPVLIDLPKDVQVADAAHLPVHAPLPVAPLPAPPDAALHEAAAVISQSLKPVIYAGGGVVLGDAVEALREFADLTGFPTVLTLKGLGALPPAHPQPRHAGHAGTRAANMAVQEADSLIVVGARFDDRATGQGWPIRPACAGGPHRRRRLRDRQAARRRRGGARRHRRQPGAPGRAGGGAERGPQRRRPPRLARDLPATPAAPCGALRRPRRCGLRAGASQAPERTGAGGGGRLRRRPAPDVGGAALALPPSAPAPDLRGRWARWASACRRRSARNWKTPTRAWSA